MIANSFLVAIGTCDAETGRFALGPFPPARVKLSIRTSGRGDISLAPHDLVAGETWDIGEVRLAPEGRLRVRFAPTELQAGPEVELSLDSQSFPQSVFEGTGAERLSPPLAPGPHTLRIGGGEFEELLLPFEIRSDTETSLDVPLRRGWRTPVAVRVPNSVAWIELRVRLPDGGVLERMLFEREGELLVGTLRLQPGSYPVEAESGSLRARGTILVEAIDRDEPALVLTLD